MLDNTEKDSIKKVLSDMRIFCSTTSKKACDNIYVTG